MSYKYSRSRSKEDNYQGGSDRDLVLDLYNYWRIFKRHWIVVVFIFGSVVAVSSMYANTQKSIYRSQGQLLFKKEDKSSFLVGLESSQ